MLCFSGFELYSRWVPLCGRKDDSYKTVCGFKSIRIRVDEALSSKSPVECK